MVKMMIGVSCEICEDVVSFHCRFLLLKIDVFFHC